MDPVWIAKYKLKAQNSLREAEKCLEVELHRAAIARAYYALYQAANAVMDMLGYARTDQGRLNWHHNEVNKNWPSLLEAIGVDDFDAETIYNAAQDFRVRIEYQTGPEPNSSDARDCVDDVKRATHWLLGALKKGGH
ncbi:hypothetical protein D3C72_518170 [compost metagenome]